MNSKAGPHGPGSLAGRIPCDAHARLQQQFGVVLGQAGRADARLRRDNKVFVECVVRTPIRHLIPPVGHLVPQPQAKREIRAELHFILEIPGALGCPKANHNGIPVQVKGVRRDVLEECQHSPIAGAAC